MVASRADWDGQAADYDEAMRPFERHAFARARAWLCSRAHGDVLDVAAGTGANLPHYPPGCRVALVDYSRPMLAHARDHDTRVRVALCQSDAHRLPFLDGSFDVAVCALSLTLLGGGPAFTEIRRVLRPGGHLLVLDHVHAGRHAWRPVREAGFRVADRRRLLLGLVRAVDLSF